MPDIVLFLLALLIQAATVQSTPEWTLEDCIRRGLSEDARMKAGEESACSERRTLERLPLEAIPSVSLTAANDLNWGRSVDMQELQIIDNRLSSYTSFAAGASLSLNDAIGAFTLRRRTQQLNVEKAVLSSDRIGESLTIDIIKAYLQLLMATQVRRKAQLSYEDIVRRRERTETEVRAGMQPESAIYEMEAQVQAEKASLVGAGNDLGRSLARLRSLMNLPAGEDLSILPPPEDSIAPPEDIPSEDEIERIADCRPQLQLALKDIGLSKAQSAEVRYAMLPRLNVSAGYGSYHSNSLDTPWKEQLRTNRNPSMSFSLSVPLFDGGRSVTSAAKARAETTLKSLEAEAIRREVREQIREAVLEVIDSYERYRAARSSLLAQEALFAIHKRQFDDGCLSGSDYSVARNSLNKAVTDYYQAKYDYLLHSLILNLYMGKPLNL